MPPIGFREDVKALLGAMASRGVLRQADREKLARLLVDHEQQLLGTVQRIVLEQLERLGLAEDFRETLEKGTADTASYLKRSTSNPRLFLIHALELAMQEMEATSSSPP